MKKPSAKKIISWVIDGLLVAVIGVLGYVQISMMTTKDANHGVPMAFGHSFLYVATDSMTIYQTDEDGEPIPDEKGNRIIVESEGVPMGSGIIIKSTKPEELKASTPIYEVDESGNYVLDEHGDKVILDFEKDGDIVTFYNTEIPAADTHRVIRVENTDQGYAIHTMGDKDEIHKGFRRFSPEARTTLNDIPPNYVQSFYSDLLIGKCVAHSMGLGTFLTLISPDAAQFASAVSGEHKTAWLLPVAIIVPLVGLALMSVIDVFRTAKAEEKQEEAKMIELMVAAGVDPNDEEAAELFKAKEELKIEYRAKMEEELERARAEARKKAEKERKKK